MSSLNWQIVTCSGSSDHSLRWLPSLAALSPTGRSHKGPGSSINAGRCRAYDPGHPCAAPAALPPATADGLPPASPARSPIFCGSVTTSISRSRSLTSFFSRGFSAWNCFSLRTSLAPAADRLLADPVPLGHRRHQLAICLAQDRHYLLFRETRFAHCSHRIASQFLTSSLGPKFGGQVSGTRRRQDRPGHFLRRRFFVFLGGDLREAAVF